MSTSTKITFVLLEPDLDVGPIKFKSSKVFNHRLCTRKARDVFMGKVAKHYFNPYTC